MRRFTTAFVLIVALAAVILGGAGFRDGPPG